MMKKQMQIQAEGELQNAVKAALSFRVRVHSLWWFLRLGIVFFLSSGFVKVCCSRWDLGFLGQALWLKVFGCGALSLGAVWV